MTENDNLILEIELSKKVIFLSECKAYPQPCIRVEVIETHMSWVFLTEKFAYKLKKPVCYDYLDFRTIKSRHFFCKEELRLNQRLTNNVYQTLIPLCMDKKGTLNLNNNGRTVDWLVCMRRLQKTLMLDYAIKNNCIRQSDVVRIVELLVKFYKKTKPEKINVKQYLKIFQDQIVLNNVFMHKKKFQLQQQRIDTLCKSHSKFLLEKKLIFETRLRAGNFLEGHGDLRPEHICLEEPISIIDCLEFSKKLRLVDTADEISFLAMECEKINAKEIATLILITYMKISGDSPPAPLLHFYQSLRATIRARITIRHLDEEKFRHSDLWHKRACEYLTLAEQHQISANALSDSSA